MAYYYLNFVKIKTEQKPGKINIVYIENSRTARTIQKQTQNTKKQNPQKNPNNKI